MTLQKNIAAGIQKLRRERHLSQVELSTFLSISQPTLSLIEQGKSSLTAEQFLNLLKHYNLGLDYFIPNESKNEEIEIQNLLARSGARHLRESPTSVSQKYSNINDLILAVLSSPFSSRQLTALAPVIAQKIQSVVFPHLFQQLKSLGQQQRLVWLIENLHRSFELRGKDSLTTPQKRTYRYATRIVEEELGILQSEYSSSQPNLREDILIRGTTALKSRAILKTKRDAIAQKWHILTDLTAKDFYKALVEADENDR